VSHKRKKGEESLFDNIQTSLAKAGILSTPSHESAENAARERTIRAAAKIISVQGSPILQNESATQSTMISERNQSRSIAANDIQGRKDFINSRGLFTEKAIRPHQRLTRSFAASWTS